MNFLAITDRFNFTARTIMKQVTLNIPENKFAFFMQLVHSLSFVEVAEPSGEYDPEFVAKIKESQQQAVEGKVTRVKKEDLKAFLGL